MPDRPAAPGTAAAAELRFGTQLPELGHFWIAHAPRGWNGPEAPWLDLAAGGLGHSARQTTALTTAARFDDLVYLPPVARERAAARDALAAALLAAGTPVMIQLLPGDLPPVPPLPPLPPLPGLPAEPPPVPALAAELPLAPVWSGELPRMPLAPDTPPPAPAPAGGLRGLPAAGVAPRGALDDWPGIVWVMDLLPVLLSGDLADLARVPPAAVAVWPLLAGITDAPQLWQAGCVRLAAAGVRQVQALVPVLGPGDRRLLAAGRDEQAFDGLFHRPAPSERAFARAACRHGLVPMLARPLPRPPLLRAENRRLAGLLSLAGDLWLRLGRPVEPAQALFRAARFCDATPREVAALVHDGNLAVLTALDPLARRLVTEAVTAGAPPAAASAPARSSVPASPALPPSIAELLAEYLADEPQNRPAGTLTGGGVEDGPAGAGAGAGDSARVGMRSNEADDERDER